MIRRLDAGVFTIVDRAVRWLHRQLGVSTYTLIQICALPILMSHGLHMLDHWFPLILPETVSGGEAVLVGVASIYWVWICRRAAQSHADQSDVLPGWLLGVRQATPLWFRVLMLALASYPDTDFTTAIEAFAHLSLLPWFAYVYLVHVDPIPPGISRVRRWWHARRAALQPAAVGARLMREATEDAA